MSSRETGTSSFMQKYCCRRREPHALCSRLKEIARLASVAVKSFTGIDTSPKDTVKDAIDRAATRTSLPSREGERIVIQENFSGFGALERRFEAALPGERVAPAIARLLESLGDIRQPEVERMRLCEFVPCEWHRHRRTRR